jgi:nucleoside-diphosphate-sugar epimerase
MHALYQEERSHHKFALSYIDDVAPVIAASIGRPKSYNQIFNVGTDKTHSVNELATVVARAMGGQSQIKHPRISFLPSASSGVQLRLGGQCGPDLTTTSGW